MDDLLLVDVPDSIHDAVEEALDFGRAESASHLDQLVEGLVLAQL